MQSMDRGLFEKFRSLVYEKSDLHFPESKHLFFERQLRSRLEIEGLKDYRAYYDHLLGSPEKLENLMQDLTTNETYFFRNRGQFNALRKEVFPGIAESANRAVIKSWGTPEKKQPGKPHPAMKIRVWSAGCSTGEEAYSIAFTLLESLSYPKAWDIEIIATDINRESLAAARAGVYEGSRLKGADDELMEKYTEPSGSGRKVKQYPASLVRFHEANLKELSANTNRCITLRGADGSTVVQNVTGYFDIIFCRNVMIYFDRAGQQRLVDALHDCVRPGGWLFTGDSEPLHLFKHGFERARTEEALYYLKPDR